MIGLYIETKNKQNKYLEIILKNVILENYVWSIGYDEVIYSSGASECLPLFSGTVLNGNDFKNCISDKDYYLLFEEIKAFPQKKTVVEISTFEDYLSSACELIILCYDTVSIEVYSKNIDILYSIKTNCLNNDFENVEEIYENTKFREIMYVR